MRQPSGGLDHFGARRAIGALGQGDNLCLLGPGMLGLRLGNGSLSRMFEDGDNGLDHHRADPDRLRADAIVTILRDCLSGVGLDPEGYCGHSLRVGLATCAIKAGCRPYKVRAQTGHSSDLMLARYVRDAGMFDENAAGAL